MRQHFLKDAIIQFRKLKELGVNAVDQVTDDDFFAKLDDESSNIAIILKHMAGNMRSRWTDFLTSDGEKPDRNRDQEFILKPEDTRTSIMQKWDDGWKTVFNAIELLNPEDLEKTVFIRCEPHSVINAINRQLTHYAYHVGQIVFLAKHFAKNNWQSLSIPKGKSEEFNIKMQDDHTGTSPAG
ncbi:MAG: DUF1572 domain-containing protein [candidate division Zixibacteria bacterium]|nr:DUF1572 domain-containing protein [candidate division Zixibacteria bacterium]